MQQALLNAYAALRAGTEVEHLRGWLHRIVRNGATKTRGPRHAPLDELVPANQNLEDLVQHRALARSALSAMRSLPDGQREALVGTALRGVARAELATSLGVSEGAVRQLVHRARTTLRSAVTALVPWPLLRWVGAGRPASGGAPELTAGVGVLGGGGALLKFGAVLATTGALVTGIGTTEDQPQHVRRLARGGETQAATVAQSSGSAVRGFHRDVVARLPIAAPGTAAHRAARRLATAPARRSDSSVSEHRGDTGDRRQTGPTSADGERTTSSDDGRTSSSDGGRTSSSDGGRTSSSDGGRTSGGPDGGSGSHDGSNTAVTTSSGSSPSPTSGTSATSGTNETSGTSHDGSSSNPPSSLDAVDGSGSTDGSGSNDVSGSKDGSGSNLSGSNDGSSHMSG